MSNPPSMHSTHTQPDDKPRLHLPRISQSVKRPSGQKDEPYYENPFYVPQDEEIFRMKNKERQDREFERSRGHALKVWEKGINYENVGKIRQIRDLARFEDDNDSYSTADSRMNINDAARSALKNRVRNREPLLKFLDKKRDMFLYQMSINDKKEQIKEFEELAHLQEVSIQNAKEMLEKDSEVFKQHVEKNKSETRQAIKNAEDETKDKQRKIQEMKRIQDELASLMSRNTKQVEKLEKLYGYKTFLDKLTPDDVMRNQRRMKEERRRARSASKGKEKVNWDAYNLNMSQGIIELLEDDDDETEMHFKKPNQLQELFGNLEEKNLFLIKHNQDIEQNIEDLRKSLANKEKELLERERALKKSKQDMEKIIQQRKLEIKQLHVKEDKFTEKTLTKLENAINTIYEKCKFLKEGKSEQRINGLDILTQVEKKLEVQLKELDLYLPQKLMEQYKVCLNKRREEISEQKVQEAREEQRRKMEVIRKRFETQKRYGRPIMARSMLKKEEKAVVDDQEEDQDEIDRRLYFTKRFY